MSGSSPLPPACDRARRNLLTLAERLGDRFTRLAGPLDRLLPASPDPERALNNLERLISGPDAPERLDALLAHDAELLGPLLGLFGTSQFLADVLIRSPEHLDLLRPDPRPQPTFEELVSELHASLGTAQDDAAVLRALRRFRQRQLLRVGIQDVVQDRPLEEITSAISRVAEASLEVALAVAWRRLAERHGEPHGPDGRPARLAVLAFGKLGGEELNYSSDIDLMFVYDADGLTRPRRGEGIGADEFFARVVTELVRMLTTHTDRGLAYRVDLRLRPEGPRGPLARSLASALSYYDAMGRTWERQALIKLRPVAGDRELGGEFLRLIEPFVYRTYFSFSEINEIRAMKRKIERKAQQAGDDARDVKTGRGGIRDIEFAIQFLQLLNGGDLPAVRVRNTLAALPALAEAGCLTTQEHQLLDDSYRFLRKTEHRLQLLFDLQTHRLPDDADELRRLALRMGYREEAPRVTWRGGGERSRRPGPLDEVAADLPLDPRPLLLDPLDAFLHDVQAKTTLNRTILDHLLHFAFGEGDAPEAPESDLVLEPDPDPAVVAAVLQRFGFREPGRAYQHLSRLAQEDVRFLSSRRCRHFLAAIAPRLLKALAAVPDPDAALLNLEAATSRLGAKAVLWELFSFNPPSLTLFVELCAHSPFLVDILVNNPGMVDELLDSLVLNRPRALPELRDELAALCLGAVDAAPILHSFQNNELLRIGVGDLLGKTPGAVTAAALTDLAEAILAQAVDLAAAQTQAKLGQPTVGEGDRRWMPCRSAVLALGKLGAREMSYHSDLDLVVVYEADGPTLPPPGERRSDEPADNLLYFTELVRRVVRVLGADGPLGKLYPVDLRLRPTGRFGSLAVSLDQFRRYHGAGGGAALWERQALTKARVVHGDAAFAREVADAVRAATYDPPWQPAFAAEIAAMRARLEAGHGQRHLKRSPGGLADVEFAVQALQLRHGRDHPELRTGHTREALEAARELRLLAADAADDLLAGYDFLRAVESRLRIVTNRAADDLPEDDAELGRLARRLGYADAAEFRAAHARHTSLVRRRFTELLANI
jgi:glutamate-ammonia-ligase adenylyltransferase